MLMFQRWYNTTYAFNAITITLYAIVSHLQKGSSEVLLKDVEKSLKIFQAMDGIAVARRCAELTQEIFEVAKMSLQDQRNRNQASYSGYADNSSSKKVGKAAAAVTAASQSRQNADVWEEIEGLDGLQEDFFASLIDPNILESFGFNSTGLDLGLSSYGNFESI
jgi:hypothetical protein